MTAVMIGEPYPQELILKNAAALVVDDGLTLLVHMDEFAQPDHDFAETPSDEDAFRGPMDVHVARFRTLPWFAIQFPLTGLVYDTPVIVAHEISARHDLQTMIEKGQNRLTIFALEGPEYLVRVIRVVGLPHTVIQALAPALTQSDDIESVMEEVADGQRWFPDSLAVVNGATTHYSFPWR